MRHLQRTQVGMALAAILLCLTSTAATVQATHEPMTSSVDTQTLSSVLHLDERSVGTMEVFRNLEQDKLPIAVLHPTDIAYGHLLQAVYNAALTNANPREPSCFIVLYTKTGRACGILRAGDKGQLCDVKTGRTFQADREFENLLKMVTNFGVK